MILTSRQRMLNALNLEPVDHIPCCFMSFTALRRRVNEDMRALTLAELAMGLDSMLFIPVAPRSERPDHPELRGLPVRLHPAVQLREWREEGAGDYPILHKEYITPAGNLRASVRLSDDWPHGDHIPFVDDFQVSRAVKPLVTAPADLAPLEYLLQPPAAEDVARFQAEAQEAHGFVRQHGVLLAGGWGVGVDMAVWLCGVQNLILMMSDQPGMAADLLAMIGRWNLARMQVVLDGKVDLYIRRAWYEGCDFLSPRLFRNLLLPQIKLEAALAHEHGAKFGYICTSGAGPVLDAYREAGIDVLIGVDPAQGRHTDMALFKRRLGDRVCLWGGVSGALTVELGSEREIREAVAEAIQVLGPVGLILSPIDNITVDVPETWRNIDLFIDEWRRRR